MTSYDLWQLEKYGNVLPSSEPQDQEPETDAKLEEYWELQLIEK